MKKNNIIILAIFAGLAIAYAVLVGFKKKGANKNSSDDSTVPNKGNNSSVGGGTQGGATNQPEKFYPPQTTEPINPNLLPIKNGSRGQEVELLQYFLNLIYFKQLGLSNLEPLVQDGIFGQKTEHMLKVIYGVTSVDADLAIQIARDTNIAGASLVAYNLLK